MHLVDAIERVRPSIVQVLVVEPEPERVRAVVGTAFLLHSDGFALTAKHVSIAAAKQTSKTNGRIMVGLAIPDLSGPITIRGSFELVGAEVVEEDPRHDLALLRLDPNPFASGKPSGVSVDPQGGMAVNAMYGLAPLSLQTVRDGESVAVSGYPLGTPALVTTHGIVASATEVDSKLVTPEGAPEGFVVPDFHDSYLLDVVVNPGNSGGPVYSVFGGTVIGTCVAFRIAEATPDGGTAFLYNSGLAIAVPIKYGVELLGRHVDLRG